MFESIKGTCNFHGMLKAILILVAVTFIPVGGYSFFRRGKVTYVA